ncbi:MAG: SET domain-containing protein-lysine N-methyltransferase [Betaproteobacteria bacterium]
MATKTSPAPAAGRRKRPFEVRNSSIHGHGVFATGPIAKGARLIEYTGEIITWKIADQRYEDDGTRGYHTFLFDVDGKKVIDAGVGGNAARWINHSCAPNCQAVGEGDKIFIEAIRNIKPGAELVYDYGFVFEERHTPELKARYACRCGAKTCRGTMVAKKK